MRMDQHRKTPPFLPIGPVLLALVLALAAGGADADRIPLDERGLPLWEVRVYDDFPVRLELGGHEELLELLGRVPIASFHREQVGIVWDDLKNYHIVFETRVTAAESRELIRAGYAFETLPDKEQEVRREAERIWAEQAERGGDALTLGERGVYHTHAQIGAILYQTMLDHPAIADTFIIGNSVQGRPIWGIHISDNVGSEEAEPEVRMSSTMHGNEPPGLEMLLYLIEFLTDEYGTDADAAYLVNNFDMHIIPCHNVDGLVAGTRQNANGVDLNRNFPVPDGSIGDDGTYTEQVETIHYKNYSFNHNFVIGEDGHSGALVVNYPWDYIYDLTPDDAAIEKLALEYSTYNLPMYNGSFSRGITRGALWYVTRGSIQDWSYQETGCIHVIIEFSNSYQPPASSLDNLWLNDNKQSFIHWIKAARYGVNGVVTGSDTGLPLAATITAAGISKSVSTDQDYGDYYKLLHTGTFDITYSAAGYTPHTEYGVSVNWGAATVINVALDPAGSGLVAGTVTESGTGTGLDATIEVRTYPGDVYVTTASSDGGIGGAYSVGLDYGDYNFRVGAPDHGTQNRVVTVNQANETENFQLDVVDYAVLFEDDFEGGASQWTGGWGLTSTQSHSPGNSMTDSPGGTYADQDTNDCVMAFPVDLSAAESCSLSFWARWQIEDNWDCCKLEISTNGGTIWTPVATAYTHSASGQGAQRPSGIPIFEGSQTTWVENVVDLGPWQSETDVRFRFRFMTDSSIHQDGFYFDDFVIRGYQATTIVAGDAPVRTRLVGNAPNPFNPTTEIRFDLAKPSVVDLRVYDISGRLIRALVPAEGRDAGSHRVLWDGRNDSGKEVASGIYLYRIETNELREIRKMVLIR
ncbi:MAG: M14 family zinc carboxypeptidase [Candidatus Eisenbacteria bacterium]